MTKERDGHNESIWIRKEDEERFDVFKKLAKAMGKKKNAIVLELCFEELERLQGKAIEPPFDYENKKAELRRLYEQEDKLFTELKDKRGPGYPSAYTYLCEFAARLEDGKFSKPERPGAWDRNITDWRGLLNALYRFNYYKYSRKKHKDDEEKELKFSTDQLECFIQYIEAGLKANELQDQINDYRRRIAKDTEKEDAGTSKLPTVEIEDQDKQQEIVEEPEKASSPPPTPEPEPEPEPIIEEDKEEEEDGNEDGEEVEYRYAEPTTESTGEETIEEEE